MPKQEPRRRKSKSARKQSRIVLPQFVVFFGLSLLLLFTLSAWWLSMTAGESDAATETAWTGSRGGLAAQATRSAAVDAMSPPATPTPIPSPTPIPPEIPLPTLTPTTVPPPIDGRAVEVSGDVTLRLVVGRDDYATTGRPVVLDVPSRAVALGDTNLTVNDRWCMQVGISTLIFDLTFALEPNSQTLNVGGNMALHDGFCDKPGPQRAVSAVAVAVPVGASARVVHTLQSDEGMLDVTKLLDTTTSLYVELLIRNPRPE